MYECHGMKYTTEYNSWRAMRERCYNKNFQQYNDYGGRGIAVCLEWKISFSAFYKDMGLKPSSKHSLDRINNNGNYEPSNCRWSLRSTQTINSRKQKGTKSKYKGVVFMVDRQQWHARIAISGKQTHLGQFKTEEEAYQARLIAEKEHYK